MSIKQGKKDKRFDFHTATPPPPRDPLISCSIPWKPPPRPRCNFPQGWRPRRPTWHSLQNEKKTEGGGKLGLGRLLVAPPKPLLRASVFGPLSALMCGVLCDLICVCVCVCVCVCATLGVLVCLSWSVFCRQERAKC